MKKITLIIAALAFNCSIAFSQGCLPEGITFTTQEQIDNFQTNYPGCTEIEGFVIISGGDEITNLNGLSVLTSIGGMLRIYSCSVLTSLLGLENITYIGGDLEVYLWPSGTSVLANLNGLNNLTTIEGGLDITNTDVLTSLTGLENVATIGGFLQIAGNEALLNLTGLDHVTSIGEEIWIGENASMIDLTGLGNLTSVGGGIEIYDDNLTSLSGLSNLNSVGGAIKINYNNNLSNLSGLAGLTSIGGYLEIYFNDVLSSLSGLDSIAPASISDIYIEYNPLLSACEVSSVCEYLVSPNGDIDITNNAPGCNSPEEVQEACEALGMEEPLAGSPCLIFPNPANEHLIIQLSLEKPEPVRITVLNISGQQMAVIVGNRTTAGAYHTDINISNWPAGVYFCRIQIGNKTITKKIVKVN
ncbi:MAG: T9SS type A sorting domain-containing protein [Lentimicrobium sp.]|nr:T9SS type A sorting domain-containing protein [Lentimicrobium sp.]